MFILKNILGTILRIFLKQNDIEMLYVYFDYSAIVEKRKNNKLTY